MRICELFYIICLKLLITSFHRDDRGGSQGEVDLIDDMEVNENGEEVEGKIFRFHS